jgi:hypothetical protein
MPNAKVRIGNWQEELVYESDRKALMTQNRGAGMTLSQRILMKAKHHRQPVELQPLPADGLLRFFMPIMLQSAETEGFVSIDMDDHTTAGTEVKYACTTAPAPSPTLRNSWIMIPVPSHEDAVFADRGEDDVVHYGQRFVLQSVDTLTDGTIFLSSQHKSPLTLSKVTRNQEAFFSAAGGQQALWTVMYANSEYRPDMEGQAVKANALVMLRHQLTNIPLASPSARYGNDFGMEFEVCCNRFLKIHAKGGQSTEMPPNLWALVTAPPTEGAPAEAGAPAEE